LRNDGSTPRPIRVCFPYVGDSVGGSHISSSLLISCLNPRRVQPVVVLHEDGPVAAHLQAQGIDYEMLRLSGYAGTKPRLSHIFGSIVRNAPTLASFLRSRRIDIVHANDLRMNLTWPLPTRLTGRRFIWHQRVVVSKSPYWRILSAAANQVLSVSRAAYDTLPRPGRQRGAVLYNPFTPEATTQPHTLAKAWLLKQIGVDGDVMVAGFVGNMTAQKRPLLFVQAAAKMAVVHKRWVFVLVGDDRGGLTNEARAMATDLGIEHRTHFVGYQRPPETWMAGFDVMLAPGVNEAYGRAIVEALLCGTPVVAADSGSNREILFADGMGAIAPADDPAAFAAAALRVTTTHDRVPLLAQSQLRERHSPVAHALKVESVYRRLLGRAPLGPHETAAPRVEQTAGLQ
jgi:glycosyltransferase involved in cell wall biosynthesis